MKKKTITYVDYNNFERTEDFYFHLNEAEAMDLELSVPGGFSTMMKRIINQSDIPALAAAFKEMIRRSYGEKSDDGKHFYKVDENGRSLADKFMQTEAYSVLYMNLLLDAENEGADFMKGIIPKPRKELVDKVEAEKKA